MGVNPQEMLGVIRADLDGDRFVGHPKGSPIFLIS